MNGVDLNASKPIIKEICLELFRVFDARSEKIHLGLVNPMAFYETLFRQEYERHRNGLLNAGHMRARFLGQLVGHIQHHPPISLFTIF
jgi:hypothetical protein